MIRSKIQRLFGADDERLLKYGTLLSRVMYLVSILSFLAAAVFYWLLNAKLVPILNKGHDQTQALIKKLKLPERAHDEVSSIVVDHMELMESMIGVISTFPILLIACGGLALSCGVIYSKSKSLVRKLT